MHGVGVCADSSPHTSSIGSGRLGPTSYLAVSIYNCVVVDERFMLKHDCPWVAAHLAASNRLLISGASCDSAGGPGGACDGCGTCPSLVMTLLVNSGSDISFISA